ncbi:acetyltransferase family protein, partial [Vibrio parahaemolyticus EKP-021]
NRKESNGIHSKECC